MKKNSVLRVLMLVAGAMVIISAGVFFLLRHFNNKAHEDKWKDYLECGIL